MKIPTRFPENGFYYHYKHDSSKSVNNYAYEVVGVGVHTEDEDQYMVVYRPLYEESVAYITGKLFTLRPLDMWMGEVVKDGKTIPRFSGITDSSIISKLEGIREKMYGK